MPASPRALSLPEFVDSIAESPPLDRTHWGVLVLDPATGHTPVELHADRHFVPASNMKLVVTAVALAELGPEYRYRTEIAVFGGRCARCPPRALVVLGRGDPTLSARYHETDFEPLEQLADSLAHIGIRRIRGDLIVDASYFSGPAIHPTWEVGDLAWGYASPTAAFAIGEGAVRVVLEPGAVAGAPARATVLGPEEALALVHSLTTDTVGARRRLSVERRMADRAGLAPDTLILTGTIAAGAGVDTVSLAVPDPERHAALALVAVLRDRGIELDGAVRVEHDGDRLRESLHDAREVARVGLESPALPEIAAGTLRPSQNWIADQLLMTLGAERGGEGSWEAGLEVERSYLFDVVGIDSTAVVLRDGSGLSVQNLLTPRATARLLDHALRQPWGEAFRLALPRPGGRGTLEERLRGLDDRVLAKTGTITHINSMSGYVWTADGRPLIFSIYSNASGRPAGEVRRAIDRIVHEIARQGGGR